MSVMVAPKSRRIFLFVFACTTCAVCVWYVASHFQWAAIQSTLREVNFINLTSTLLATHFAQKYVRTGQNSCQISPEAMDILLASPWPGNVRQLENAIERGCVTARDGVIRPENLPAELSSPTPARNPFQIDLERPLPEQVAELTASFEEQYLRQALKKAGGNVGRCAEISGLSRRSITDRFAQYRIDKSLFKE